MEVGEDFLEHHARCLKGGIGKEEPAKTDEMEGENDGQEATNARRMVAFVMPQTVLPCFVSAECRSMKGAPHYEVPRGSMPQAAENHGHKLIKIHAPTAATVAPHRNIEVVAKPGGEGDVPTAPKVGDTVGLVGGAEVGGNLEAHPEGDTNGDVAVAREVAIELQGIAIDTHEIFKSGVKRGVVEDAVDKVLSDIVGDDGLLEESHHDEPQTCAKHLARHNERLPELGQEGAGTKDGARKQSGKEGDKKGQVEQVTGGAHLAAIDVDDVAQRLEGEEGDTGNSYASGDKETLQLPQVQLDLMEAMAESGKPVVLCLMAGSDIDLSYAEEHFDAVMVLWYPGAEGGKAAARVLFGDVSPSGKLPVTFYNSLEELPDFTDYAMKGRTYRYMENKAQLPFGYGLTYGKVVVTDAVVSENSATDTNGTSVSGKAGFESGTNTTAAPVTIQVTVTNQGTIDTRDVVQIYIKNADSSLAVPNPELAAFTPVFLKAGETKTVTLSIAPKAFTVVDETGARTEDGSHFHIYVGCTQPDERSVELAGVKPLEIEYSK